LEKAVAKGEKYDVVYGLAILEHISWPAELLRKISKVVKRGGRVVVEVPNVAWLPHRANLLLGRFPETAPTYKGIPGVEDEHIRFYTLASLDKVFSRAGFGREKLESAGRLRGLKRLWPGVLSPDICAVYKEK
jgi:SAM-dependent methyltransferase